jgi:hypothetical protein
VSESRSQVKPFDIPKSMVWEAYQRVKANKGRLVSTGSVDRAVRAGLEEQPVQTMESPLVGGLLPAAGQAVSIPAGGKESGSSGCPLWTDRIAQTVAAMSGAGWSRSSTLTPMATARDVCVGRGGSMPGAVLEERLGVDLDIGVLRQRGPLAHAQGGRHTDQKWILLYVKRWLPLPAAAGRHPGRPGSGTHRVPRSLRVG